YPKCGHVIGTPMDEHQEEVTSMAANLSKSSLGETIMQIPLTREGFLQMIEWCRTKQSVNLKKLHVLLALYAYARFKEMDYGYTMEKGTKQPFRFSTETSRGYEFYASIRYLCKFMKISDRTVSKYMKELDCIHVLERGHGGFNKIIKGEFYPKDGTELTG